MKMRVVERKAARACCEREGERREAREIGWRQSAAWKFKRARTRTENDVAWHGRMRLHPKSDPALAQLTVARADCSAVGCRFRVPAKSRGRPRSLEQLDTLRGFRLSSDRISPVSSRGHTFLRIYPRLCLHAALMPRYVGTALFLKAA